MTVPVDITYNAEPHPACAPSARETKTMSDLSRRAVLAGAATLPAIAIPAPASPAQAELARAEFIIDLFRTRYIHQNWKLDEAEAGRFLRYFRNQAAGFPEDDEAFHDDVVEFCRGLGGTIEWLLTGDVSGLICRSAAAECFEL